MTAGYQEFPKWMKHPNEQPAIVSDDLPTDAAGRMRAVEAKPGRAAMFPPVLVNNADQEAYHAAKGYAPAGKGNAVAAMRAIIAPIPTGYTHHEYPRIENGQVIEDPNRPMPVDNRYPKWVHFDDGRDAVLVQNEAAELALKPPPPPPAPSEAEREFLAAIAVAETRTDERIIRRPGRPKKAA